MNRRTVDHLLFLSGAALILAQGVTDIKYADTSQEKADIRRLMYLGLAVAAFGWYVSGQVKE